MKKIILIYSLFLSIISTSVAFASCPIERSRYLITGNRDFSAGFYRIKHQEGWVSDLALFVHSYHTHRTFWFLFDEGTAIYTNLISTTNIMAKGWKAPDQDGGVRPLDEMRYLATDKKFVFFIRAPQPHNPRPEYILLPDLPEVMWYVAEPREGAGLAFFKFDHCARR